MTEIEVVLLGALAVSGRGFRVNRAERCGPCAAAWALNVLQKGWGKRDKGESKPFKRRGSERLPGKGHVRQGSISADLIFFGYFFVSRQKSDKEGQECKRPPRVIAGCHFSCATAKAAHA